MDVSVILLLLTALAGACWLLDRFVWSRAKNRHTAHANAPWWIEYTAGMFRILLLVLVIRSFIVEPFKIPSGSMMPTLMNGDFILVNKYVYGLRLPVLHNKILDTGSPSRGDVVVFRHPPDPSTHYIKRVIGLPGELVRYEDKRLTINDEEVPTHLIPNQSAQSPNQTTHQKTYQEQLDNHKYKVLHDDRVHANMSLSVSKHLINQIAVKLESQSSFDGSRHDSYFINSRANNVLNSERFDIREEFPFMTNCKYSEEGFVCKVPEGHYFVLGDNRDNSQDSRFWGFVPEQNIVGQAFIVAINFSNLKRFLRLVD